MQRDPIRCLETLTQRYGPTVVFARGADRQTLVTRDPGLARELLAHPGFRGSGLSLPGPRGSAQRRIRKSLFREQGASHLHHRRLVGETLTRRSALAAQDTMRATLDASLESWKPGVCVDLKTEMKQLARRVSARILFGQGDLAASDRLGVDLECWFRRNFATSTRLLPLDLPGLPYRTMLREAAGLEARVVALIRARRASPHPGTGDLLARLVAEADRAGGLAEEELVAQTFVLFLAAHETTAMALIGALVLLAQHPEVAQPLAADLRDLGPEPTLEALDALPSLDRALRESLRLLPVVPFGSRVATERISVPALDLTLGRGSRLVVAYDLIHRACETYPAPDRFLPQRWAGDSIPSQSYLPFSSGPHMCLGPAFAMATLKLTVGTVVRRFRFRLRPGARLDRRVTVTLGPAGPVPFEILPAEAPFEQVTIRGNLLQDRVGTTPVSVATPPVR